MIVGLCGAIGSGKTTAAKHLVDARGFERVRFAGPLKNMMKALGLTYDEIDGHLKEEPCELLGGKTPRHAMQSIGTEWGRELIDPDLWVRAWKRNAQLATSFHIVADDVRFPNEVDMIRSMGGKIIKVERPGVGLDGHISENNHLVPDHVIVNSHGIPYLEGLIEGVLGL
jgi:hypothetical protein